MKKIIRRLGICFSVVAISNVNVLAVWPPHTALEQGSAAPTPDSPYAISNGAHDVVEKLRSDEFQLQQVLLDLKKDRQELREAAATHPATGTPPRFSGISGDPARSDGISTDRRTKTGNE